MNFPYVKAFESYRMTYIVTYIYIIFIYELVHIHTHT